MTTYSPDNSYFRVTMRLLMAQLHNTDFLKVSKVKVQNVMLTSAHLSLEILKTCKYFVPNFLFMLGTYHKTNFKF